MISILIGKNNMQKLSSKLFSYLKQQQINKHKRAWKYGIFTKTLEEQILFNVKCSRSLEEKKNNWINKNESLYINKQTKIKQMHNQI
jgi:hypothetical protein